MIPNNNNDIKITINSIDSIHLSSSSLIHTITYYLITKEKTTVLDISIR
jgi:hypothetical protein